MNWYIVLFIIAVVLLVWLAWRYIKSNPEQFSRENLGKSSTVLAVLALLLIAFIVLLVLLVKS